VLYKCDFDNKNLYKWQNKLFMPQWAARYFIEITAVRCERLHDISDEDCLKEGIEYDENMPTVCGKKWLKNYRRKDEPFLDGNVLRTITSIGYSKHFTSKQMSYFTLITSIHGKGIVESNPVVWVYDFKLTNKK
jgi:hypothetical protein